ncbi:energy-coupling factor ABC transporter ATP-binding protein [Shewanella marisflavi]|uniref:Energy-coupling factor ABC transporter ATP-binding protein n=2 Tax=Shewanellaceae TaxID=267890 RepID=A0ABX5WQY8_9GAMM|nr:energy-coupling factor ABC transporter ATP-binding protein [Shewanella marisflavi]QDF76977.1 energy-coupling factor ABC transporter ATP-binding protein [Shewanella marisflavi]
MVKIIANNIEMRFGNRLLYRFERLSLSQHQTIHLQGDNGSGKTTLMKMLAGLQAPSHGKIYTEGFTPTPWWRRNPLLGKAVYLHQHPYLFDGTVAYNLNYVQPLCDLTKQEITSRTQTAIDMAQLGDLLNQRAASLSGGERQRLAIARAWIMRPQLLMLDEPTSNMDKLSQQLVLTMISHLKQQGTGMLISSHQTCSLTSLCEQTWQIQAQSIQVSPSTLDELTIIPSQQELRYVTAN